MQAVKVSLQRLLLLSAYSILTTESGIHYSGSILHAFPTIMSQVMLE